MKVYELSKKVGMSNKELLQETGLKSHLSVVPEDILAKYITEEPEDADTEITEDVVAEVVAEIKEPKIIEEWEPIGKCPVSLETLELSLRGGGDKSPYWKYRGLLEE